MSFSRTLLLVLPPFFSFGPRLQALEELEHGESLLLRKIVAEGVTGVEHAGVEFRLMEYFRGRLDDLSRL